MPATRRGHATAPATKADSIVWSRDVVLPKRAWTAQPKIAFRILPADFEMSAKSACRIAIPSKPGCEPFKRKCRG
jgi:hypothetical protein